MYAKDSFVAHMWRKPDDPRTRAKYTLKAGQVNFCMRRILIRWLLFLSWKLIESIIPEVYCGSEVQQVEIACVQLWPGKRLRMLQCHIKTFRVVQYILELKDDIDDIDVYTVYFTFPMLQICYQLGVCCLFREFPCIHRLRFVVFSVFLVFCLSQVRGVLGEAVVLSGVAVGAPELRWHSLVLHREICRFH